LFISSLSAGCLARIEGLLDELVRDVREGRKEPTIVSTYEDDDELAWNELERELVGDGITREDARQYKEEIRNYLRRLVEENIEDNTEEITEEITEENTEEIGLSDSFSLANELDDSYYSTDDEPAIPEGISSDVLEVLNTSGPARDRLFNTPCGRLTLAERQALVFVATRSERQSRGLSWPGRIERRKAYAVVKELAFSTEPFDYDAYERLGRATDDIETLPLKSIFRVSKPNFFPWFHAFEIYFALTKLNLKHVEIPSGFRCLWRDKLVETLE
jgi:hypothetical protein